MTGIRRSKVYRKESGERGSSIIMALLGSLVLAVIVSASLSRTLFTWNTIGHSYHHTSALYTAEGGVEMAIYAMNHQEIADASDPASVGGEFAETLLALTGLEEITQISGKMTDPTGRALGDYEVGLVNDPDNPRRFVVTSVGTSPPADIVSKNPASRTVRVVIEKPPLFPEHDKLFIDDAVVSENDITLNGSTSIHGNTRSNGPLQTVSGDEDEDPDSHVTQWPYDWMDPETGETGTSHGVVYDELGESTEEVTLPFDDPILEQYRDVAKWQGYYFDRQPDTAELPTDFYRNPDTDEPNVVYISSPEEVKLKENSAIGGLIFIRGDVTFGGGMQIHGIVYATGLCTFKGGGSQTNVDGAIYAGAVDIRGVVNVTYNYDYYFTLLSPPQPEPKYIFQSWQELVGTQVADTGGSLDGTLAQ